MPNAFSQRLNSVTFEFDPPRQKEIVLSPDEVRFKSLLLMMERKSLSYREAVKIVGGDVTLKRFIENGEIRCDKPDGSPNRKWRINAADCYRHIKPRLKELKMLNAQS